MKRKAGRIGSHIEVTAEHEHNVTLITKLSHEDAVSLMNATKGILWFLLQHKGEPLNPNHDCFSSKTKRETGLSIFLDFNQELINCLTDPEGDQMEEIFIDDFVDRWEKDRWEKEGPKKCKAKKRD
jgi:hypothetical protein